MRVAVSRQALLSLLVLTLIVSLLNPKPAQAATYHYYGPAWDLSQCATHCPTGTCVNGNVTGSVEFPGISIPADGWLYPASMGNWSIEATGIGTLGPSNRLNGSTKFHFASGHLDGWTFSANYDSAGHNPVITTLGAIPGYYDSASVGSPSITSCGFVSPTGGSVSFGQWIGPRMIGAPQDYKTCVPNPNPTHDHPEPDPNKTCPDGLIAQGDPVDISTGNVFEEITDYTTVGANPLAFIRYYNSMASDSTPATALGRNWRSNYDRYLRGVTSAEVDAERPDGKIITFILVSGVWTPDTDVDMTLTNSGSTYTLKDHGDMVETYTVSGSRGTLNSIALPNGYTQTLNYTSGVLTSVSDSYSRSLSFTYTSGLLTGVSTPDSATLTYGYTTTDGKPLLTSVTYNTSPSTSQTYVYGNSSYPFALTGITDENGNTYATWTYDGLGRATDAQHAGGADEIQISYSGATTRVVTNGLGEQETYTFAWKQGVLKVTSIARAANSPVVAATRSFTYDTNGYLATATDWNGNSTHWTNNSHGEPTSITEAYDTGRARTATITYDSTWVHKPYTITRTNQTVDYRYDSSTGNLLTKTLTDTTGGSTNGQTHTWTYTSRATRLSIMSGEG